MKFLRSSHNGRLGRSRVGISSRISGCGIGSPTLEDGSRTDEIVDGISVRAILPKRPPGDIGRQRVKPCRPANGGVVLLVLNLICVHFRPHRVVIRSCNIEKFSGGWMELPVVIRVHHHRQSPLSLIVETANTPGFLLRRSQSGQEQRRQDSNDGNDTSNSIRVKPPSVLFRPPQMNFLSRRIGVIEY
ncbi:MAG: hypothetical protein JWM99_1389 [Verrucomicrobiales bacterium]|nr:hypothetical protein [Verrucomicrobiales bacterium]